MSALYLSTRSGEKLSAPHSVSACRLSFENVSLTSLATFSETGGGGAIIYEVIVPYYATFKDEDEFYFGKILTP